MKLNELKQGMVCERRDGSKITILNNNAYALHNGYVFITNESHNDDLTSKDNRQYDIMKVIYGDKVVWERKESTFWLPEKGEKYYFLSHRKVTEAYTNENDDWDRELFKATLVFKTREEAEKQFIKQQATIRVIKEIARLNEGWLPNWNDDGEHKHCIETFFDDDGLWKLLVEYHLYHKALDNNLYLKSEELAEQLIKTHEQDLKLMLEVE